jgi:D-alanyl-D-alanine dipeptidase
MYGCAIDFGGILLSGGTRVAKLSNSTARKSKTYQFLLGLQEDGFKNYSVEPWHWSVDGK